MDELSKGDMVIAYQVDTRELFGLCMVTRIIQDEIYLRWTERFRQNVPSLKKEDPDGVGTIRAFMHGPMRTIYEISKAETKLLLAAVHAATNQVEFLNKFKIYLPKNGVKSHSSQIAYITGVRHAGRINGGHLGPSDLPNKEAVEPFWDKLIGSKNYVPSTNDKNQLSHLRKYAEMVEKLGLRSMVGSMFRTSKIRAGKSLAATQKHENVYIEGLKRTITAIERNANLRIDAKKKYGLKCCCCGFKFEDFYGDWASQLAIVHHVKQFKRRRRKAHIGDVRVVCANCHLVIHAKKKPRSVEAMHSRLAKRWTPWTESGIAARH